MTAILSLLVVIFVSMLITRIATIALAATGLSRESARFQARSALTGSGFTTSESESVVRHPVRRRIVMMLMLVGSAGIAAVIGSLVLAFVQPDAAGDWWIRIAVLMAGIAGLWVFASSAWIDRRITRITMWALDRYTSIDVRDYASLLHIGGDYVITELTVPDGHWLADQSLAELDLRREGIMLLGVVRPDGEYLGVPRRDTVLHAGDTLVLYSRAGQLAELDARRRDEAGDESHRHAVEREADAREAHRG
jgi:hypothetical protein